MHDATGRLATTYYQVATILLLMILVGFTITGVWGAVTWVMPSLTVREYDWDDVASRDRFLLDYEALSDGRYVNLGDTITTEQVTQRWQRKRTRVLENQSKKGVQAVLNWGIALVVCLPLYLFHHGVVRKGGGQEPRA